MDTAKLHWEILRQVPDELARKVRAFMVVGYDGDGVMLATENGEGYWMGEMYFGDKWKQATKPTRLDVSKLASMAKGYNHILLLTESGQIGVMGKNDKGQLGLGTVDKESHLSPQLISSPHKFISVRCGYWHNLALTEDGKVWAWGLNDCGQVGMPSSTKFLPSPRKISKLNLCRVVGVECGANHSLALTDKGEAYGWGNNVWGQLGKRSNSPTRIPTPSPVKSVVASDSHTLLLTRTGEVYACGYNGNHELGLSSTTPYSTNLVKVAGLPPISQIASHYHASFSVAMSADRKCFVWGQFRNPLDNNNKRIAISITLQLPSIYSTLDSALSFASPQHNTPHSVRVEGLECLRRIDPETETESQTGSAILSRWRASEPYV